MYQNEENTVMELTLTQMIHLGIIYCRECQQPLLEQICYAGDFIGLWAEHKDCYENRDPMTTKKLGEVLTIGMRSM